jgi:DNA-binding MurR/RpiR family transcriptional regulator
METLTPNESKVAKFCLANPEIFINRSIHDIASATDVSVASVSRLANTLGYGSWKEMRLALAKEVAAFQGGTAMENPIYPEIGQSDEDDVVIDKVFNGNSLSIQNTLRQVEKAKIKEVAGKIHKASLVTFFGSGGSGYIARDEALRFSHLKVTAHASTEDYQMMLEAAKLKRGHVAFGFSNSGRTRSTVTVLAEARKCGATTVAISNFANTPLEKNADYFFQTYFPAGGGITAALTARAALQTIMDAIYVLAAQYGSISDRVNYMNEILEAQLRLPSKKR